MNQDEDQNGLPTDDQHEDAENQQADDLDAGEQNSADGDQDDDNGDQQDEDEVVVTIAGEEQLEQESKRAPPWLRDLRKQNVELKRQIKALTASQSIAAEKPPVVLGKKPRMEDPEIDWDQDKLEAATDAWYAQKREVEQQEASARAAKEQEAKAWQATLGHYAEKKTALKAGDFAEAEDVTRDALSIPQQGIILQGAADPALVVYALGKNPKKAAEFAAITDHVKFAVAIGKFEKDLTVTTRKASTAPPPERQVSGSGRKSGTVASNLETLREQARTTGDYSKVAEYNRQQAAKAKAVK